MCSHLPIWDICCNFQLFLFFFFVLQTKIIYHYHHMPFIT